MTTNKDRARKKQKKLERKKRKDKERRKSAKSEPHQSFFLDDDIGPFDALDFEISNAQTILANAGEPMPADFCADLLGQIDHNPSSLSQLGWNLYQALVTGADYQAWPYRLDELQNHPVYRHYDRCSLLFATMEMLSLSYHKNERQQLFQYLYIDKYFANLPNHLHKIASFLPQSPALRICLAVERLYQDKLSAVVRTAVFQDIQAQLIALGLPARLAKTLSTKLEGLVSAKELSSLRGQQSLDKLDKFLSKHQRKIFDGSPLSGFISFLTRAILQSRLTTDIDMTKYGIIDSIFQTNFKELAQAALFHQEGEQLAQAIRHMEAKSITEQLIKFMTQRVDTTNMSYVERLRYHLQLLSLKLNLYRQLLQVLDSDAFFATVSPQLVEDFLQLFDFCQRGVPSENKTAAQKAQERALQFLIEACLSFNLLRYKQAHALESRLVKFALHDARVRWLLIWQAGLQKKAIQLPDAKTLCKIDPSFFAKVYLKVQQKISLDHLKSDYQALDWESKKQVIASAVRQVLQISNPSQLDKEWQKIEKTFLIEDTTITTALEQGRPLENPVLLACALSLSKNDRIFERFPESNILQLIHAIKSSADLSTAGRLRLTEVCFQMLRLLDSADLQRPDQILETLLASLPQSQMEKAKTIILKKPTLMQRITNLAQKSEDFARWLDRHLPELLAKRGVHKRSKNGPMTVADRIFGR